MVMRSIDRIIVLERVDPKKEVGLFDTQVFTGKNNLHAVMDQRTCMWSLKYERGLVPEAIRYKFTNFKILLDQLTSYLAMKNIRIVEIKD